MGEKFNSGEILKEYLASLISTLRRNTSIHKMSLLLKHENSSYLGSEGNKYGNRSNMIISKSFHIPEL